MAADRCRAANIRGCVSGVHGRPRFRRGAAQERQATRLCGHPPLAAPEASPLKLALAMALLLAFSGVALVAAAPTASACIPYSVCALQHDLRCANATTDPVEKVECVDLH